MILTISIVSFNTKDLLTQLLKSLIKSKKNYPIFIIDNNSQDGSVEMLEKEFKGVNLIKNNINLGFAKGHNIVLKDVKTKYVLLLNPDIKINPDDIKRLIEFMEDNPNCGILSTKIIGFDNKTHSNGGDLPVGVSLISWLFNLETFGIKQNFHRSDSDYYKNTREVGWVGGTVMMIRKSVLDKIGTLDEDYFMYFEDTEFCFRAKKAGFKIMLNPNIVIAHKSGASSKDPRFSQWRGEYWGLIHFYKKNYGYMASLAIRILVYFSIILRIIAFSIRARYNIVKTYAKILISI